MAEENNVPEQKSQKVSRVLKCGKCDYSCINGSSLTYHRQAKHSDLRCVCTQCDKEFKTNLDLVAHNRKLHKVGYFCFLCAFSSDAMKLMIRHRGKVHPESKKPEQVDTNSLNSEKGSPNPADVKDEQEIIKSEPMAVPAPKKTRVVDKMEKERKKQLWAEYYPKHKEKIRERNNLRNKRKRQECDKQKERLKVKSEGDPIKSEPTPETFG